MTQGSHSDLIILEKLSYVCTEYIVRELTSGLCKGETLELPKCTLTRCTDWNIIQQ